MGDIKRGNRGFLARKYIPPRHSCTVATMKVVLLARVGGFSGFGKIFSLFYGMEGYGSCMGESAFLISRIIASDSGVDTRRFRLIPSAFIGGQAVSL